ncbi:MAG: hypothetical protein IJA69_04375 [Clostridia bacterium]|nr:hypothetical protein [Clostridia bacterium]
MAVYKKPTMAPPPKGPNGEEYVPIAAMMRRAGRMPTDLDVQPKVDLNLAEKVKQSQKQPSKKYGECDGVYFVQEPQYNAYQTSELLQFMYIPQRKTYREIKYYNSVDEMFAKKKNIEVVSAFYKYFEEKTNKYPEFKSGEVDLSLMDKKEMAQFMDMLFENSNQSLGSKPMPELKHTKQLFSTMKNFSTMFGAAFSDDTIDLVERFYNRGINHFETFYHEGNLDVNQYLSYTCFDMAKLFRYIQDPACVVPDKTQHRTCLEMLQPKEIQCLIAARKLVLSHKQQEKLFLKNFAFKQAQTLTKKECQNAIILFEFGAIYLNKQELKKLVNDCKAHNLKSPNIEMLVKAIESGKESEIVEQLQTTPFENGFQQNYTKESEIQQTGEAADFASEWEKQENEDEMDKLFAEAQKNIEMER